GRVFQSDGKEVKLTLTGYFWRYGIRKAIQVSIFRMNLAFKFFPCRQANFSGRYFLDSYSRARKTQRIASLKSS
ncbi:hypothetical protein ABMY07_24135, partial [Vibrio vulnificus]